MSIVSLKCLLPWHQGGQGALEVQVIQGDPTGRRDHVIELNFEYSVCTFEISSKVKVLTIRGMLRISCEGILSIKNSLLHSFSKSEKGATKEKCCTFSLLWISAFPGSPVGPGGP